MPPKQEQLTVEGIEIGEMPFPRLQEFVSALLQKLNSVRKERNFLQVQCAQMRTAWEMSRLKLDECKAQIKHTAMARDELEKQGTSKLIKEIEDETKYLIYDHNVRVKQIKQDTQNKVSNMTRSWAESVLNRMLDSKADLKLKLEEQTEETLKKRNNYQHQANTDLEKLAKALDEETDKIFKKEIERSEKSLNKLKLMSDTAFFRIQEEYNSLFAEMNQNGKDNFSVLRDFYKTVTEDDIIMILILNREVKKIMKIVKQKTGMCKKMKRQIAHLEASRGKLEVNLRRARLRMKHYDTWVVNLDRMTTTCDTVLSRKSKMQSQIDKKADEIHKLDKQAKDLNVFLDEFCGVIVKRQDEVLKPLRDRIFRLGDIFDGDRVATRRAIRDAPSEVREKAEKEFKITQAMTETSIRPYVADLALACKAHDDVVDSLWANVKMINLPYENFKAFQKINFNIAPYGRGPAGLVSKYPKYNSSIEN